MKTILIAGTHGKDDDWWKPGSSFCLGLKAFGVEIACPPFEWSTKLDGLTGVNGDWIKAGRDLVKFAEREPSVNIVAHSHGGQIAGYAAYNGLKIHRLVTIGTPVRGDMELIFDSAKESIGHWTHIHDARFDFWQFLGGIADGRLGFYQKMKYADENIGLPNIGHSGALSASLIYRYLV